MTTHIYESYHWKFAFVSPKIEHSFALFVITRSNICELNQLFKAKPNLFLVCKYFAGIFSFWFFHVREHLVSFSSNWMQFACLKRSRTSPFGCQHFFPSKMFDEALFESISSYVCLNSFRTLFLFTYFYSTNNNKMEYFKPKWVNNYGVNTHGKKIKMDQIKMCHHDIDTFISNAKNFHWFCNKRIDGQILNDFCVNIEIFLSFFSQSVDTRLLMLRGKTRKQINLMQ